MQGRICAYCSRQLERYDELEVEHFRPKNNVADDPTHGGYWWLAYEFDNYFLGCRTCNATSTKGSKFPLLDATAVRVTWHTRGAIAKEPRAFVDPCVDVWLDDGFVVKVEDLTCIFEASPGLSDDQRNRFDYTCKFFHLNDDPEVLRARVGLYDLVLDSLANKKDCAVTPLACRFMPYSAVVRQLLKVSAPHLLPTPEQELEYLLGELVRDLLNALELMERDAENERAVRLATKLMWAFAVLWKDPPSGTPEVIGVFLRERGLEEKVREFYNRL